MDLCAALLTPRFHSQTFQKAFKVQQYVLPRFLVSVAVPSDVLYQNGHFLVTVNASYTYGSPFKGSATITVKLWGWTVQTVTVDVDGSRTVEIDMTLMGITYMATATVSVDFTDPLTSECGP